MDLAYMTLWEAGYFLPPDPPRKSTVAEPVSLNPVEKGCCKHCGRKIGRGLHFHEKACAE